MKLLRVLVILIFEERILRAAYNFSTDERLFIDENLIQYYKFQMNEYGTSRSEFSLNRYCKIYKGT
jgi:hypothetical protein